MKSRLILTALVVALFVLLMGVAHADDTITVTVAFYDSSGRPPSGTVQVYRNGWQSLAMTDANDQMDTQLPSGSYTFRMSYGYAYNQKTQDVGTDSTVVFGTVKVRVELRAWPRMTHGCRSGCRGQVKKSSPLMVRLWPMPVATVRSGDWDELRWLNAIQSPQSAHPDSTIGAGQHAPRSGGIIIRPVGFFWGAPRDPLVAGHPKDAAGLGVDIPHLHGAQPPLGALGRKASPAAVGATAGQSLGRGHPEDILGADRHGAHIATEQAISDSVQVKATIRLQHAQTRFAGQP